MNVGDKERYHVNHAKLIGSETVQYLFCKEKMKILRLKKSLCLKCFLLVELVNCVSF